MSQKCVIYARYSSDRQREESIEGQIRVCEDFAQRNDLEVIQTYVDRALTARTDRRPAFQQMISDGGLSSQVQHLREIGFIWCSVTKTFSWTQVQLINFLLDVFF